MEVSNKTGGSNKKMIPQIVSRNVADKVNNTAKGIYLNQFSSDENMFLVTNSMF